MCQYLAPRAGISLVTQAVQIVTIFHTSKSQATPSNPDERAPSTFSRGALKVKTTLTCGLNFYMLAVWEDVRTHLY